MVQVADSGRKQAQTLIKSYGRRSGRMRESEKEALVKVLPSLQIKTDRVLDFEKIFGRKAPVFLEIGFGNGAFLYDKAVNNPDKDFIGIEVYYTGVAKLLRRLAKSNKEIEVNFNHGHSQTGAGRRSTDSVGTFRRQSRGCRITDTNHRDTEGCTVRFTPEDTEKSLFYPSSIRIMIEDSRVVLEESIPPYSLDGIYILFPDPWPKKRHHKRRLINADFTGLFDSRLKAGGFVVTATDDSNYAEVIEEAFSGLGFSKSEAKSSGVAETKYARKAVKEGRGLNVVKWVKGSKAGIRG